MSPAAGATTAAAYAARPSVIPAARATEPKTIEQVNSARAALRGVNQRPLPSGVVTNHPNGGVTVKTAAGSEYAVRANGTLKAHTNGTQTVTFRANGRVASLHTPGVDIRRGTASQKTIISRRADKSVLVSTAPHRGYLERTVISGNR